MLKRGARLVLVFVLPICFKLTGCLPAPHRSLRASRYLLHDDTTPFPAHLLAVASDPGALSDWQPAFHLSAGAGWMNDPNGMFQTVNGTFHVFFQHNPAGVTWGAPYWGHVMSEDLVHWKRLPSALVPDSMYDYDGVFSGSATVLNNGTPALLFTGVSGFAENGFFYQTQALAVPANASDLELKRWIKNPANPVIGQVPPQGSPAQFRDPTSAWQAEGWWWMAVGTQQNCSGSAALYRSQDFEQWQYHGQLFSWAGLSGSNAKCPLAEGGECNQFAAGCAMWECPDVFQLGDVTVFKFSDQVIPRDSFGRDWYVLSDQALNYGSQDSVFLNSYQGVRYQPRLLDYGSIYASKSFPLLDGRRMWLGWVYETSVGCWGLCGDGTPLSEAMGWQGMLTLPREIHLDRLSAALRLVPARELRALRGRQLLNRELALDNNTQAVTLLPGGPLVNGTEAGRQLEILVRFNLSMVIEEGNPMLDDALPFSVGVVLEMGPSSELTVELSGMVSPADPDLALTASELELTVDSTSVGGASSPVIQGGRLPDAVPPARYKARFLDMRLFVDHSVVESYVVGGRGVATTRVYPLVSDHGWGVSAFVHAPEGGVSFSADARVWQLGSCWLRRMNAGHQCQG